MKRRPHWRAHTAQIRTFFFLRAPPTSTAAHAISSHVGSKRPGLGRLPPGHILLITKLPGQGVSKEYTRVNNFHNNEASFGHGLEVQHDSQNPTWFRFGKNIQ